LYTDLGVFELGAEGAELVSRHPWATPQQIAERTGFEYRIARSLPVTSEPDPDLLAAIRAFDRDGLRDQLVG
ncbi:MAG: glutaconate CoA-transferase, partial [Acidobacteriota bacterium]